MPNPIENGRASFAYQRVSEIAGSKSEKETKDYRSLARSFPVMIQTNGFGTSVAFLFSKKKGNPVHQSLYDSISKWLKEQNLITNDLMDAVTKQDRNGYKMIANETMALLLWIKRFAEGMIDSGSDSKK